MSIEKYDNKNLLNTIGHLQCIIENLSNTLSQYRFEDDNNKNLIKSLQEEISKLKEEKRNRLPIIINENGKDIKVSVDLQDIARFCIKRARDEKAPSPLIRAIKYFREKTGYSLVETKNIIEYFWNN